MTERLSRRRFLKLGALVASGVATVSAVGSHAFDGLFNAVGDAFARIPAFRANAQTTGELVGAQGESIVHASMAPAPVPGKHRWVMVIDLAKCDGCKECTQACNAMHFVPPGQEWIKVYENRDNKVAGAYWFPRPCMQCDNSPCAKVCPVGATFKREDGTVLIDQDRCIGCRYCIAACPYGSRSFNWVDPRPHVAGLNPDFPTRTKGVGYTEKVQVGENEGTPLYGLSTIERGKKRTVPTEQPVYGFFRMPYQPVEPPERL